MQKTSSITKTALVFPNKGVLWKPLVNRKTIFHYYI